MTEEATPAPEKSTAPVERPSATLAMDGKDFIWGTGRRKASVARVRIRPGDGKFVVNKRELKDYFVLAKDREAILTPLEVTEAGKSVDVFVNVNGGGVTGQAGAVLLGLARALAKADADHLPKLREKNLLHRDPRRVERKKYGQRGARRRFQFSKR